MVDATESTESDNIVVDFVKNSKTKKLVVLGEGEYQEFDGRRKLVIPVQIDKKHKNWLPNRSSAEAMVEAYGSDTIEWIGQVVSLKVIKDTRGKDMIMALPEKGPQKEDI